MNLTTVNGTYAKELKEHISEIAQMVNSRLSVEGMKTKIRAIIKPAYIYKYAKPRFYGYLKGCRSKEEILRLCENTIRKAANYNG